MIIILYKVHFRMFMPGKLAHVGHYGVDPSPLSCLRTIRPNLTMLAGPERNRLPLPIIHDKPPVDKYLPEIYISVNLDNNLAANGHEPLYRPMTT